jgi:hypothetical protein
MQEKVKLNKCRAFAATLTMQPVPVMGFAFGAQREAIQRIKLPDKMISGGADNLFCCSLADCHSPYESYISRFAAIALWRKRVRKEFPRDTISCAGDVRVYHMWHGPIADRQYIQRYNNLGSDVFASNFTYDSDGVLVLNNPDAIKRLRAYFTIRNRYCHDDRTP